MDDMLTIERLLGKLSGDMEKYHGTAELIEAALQAKTPAERAKRLVEVIREGKGE